jgi:hypothetical protein
MFAWRVARRDRRDLMNAILLAMQIGLSGKKDGIFRLLRRLSGAAALLLSDRQQRARAYRDRRFFQGVFV